MKRPNILFVFADQLRYSALACNGNNIIKTPNFDRLANEGLSFNRAFSCGPICGPYRAQILTGNYSHTNGVMCNEYRLFDNQQTLAHRLGKNGYRTAYVGKWHLGYGPYPEHKRYGFDDLYSYNCIHNYYDVSFHHNENGPFKINEFAPRTETKIALDYLKSNSDSENPTCIVLGWGPPHWNGLNKKRRYGDYPQEYNIYNPNEIELSNNVPRQFVDHAKNEIADYYGMVTALDDCMGEILDELKNTGLDENTIVCFSSDHGDHLSAHGFGTPADNWMHHSLRGSKATPYDEACHIPFLIKGPGVKKRNNGIQNFFSSVDVLPTLLELCDLPSPDDVQGQSIASIIKGISVESENSVFLQNMGTGWPNREKWLGLWRGVRNDRWTYARWFDQHDKMLLFDLEADSEEMINLSYDPSYKKVLDEMEELLQTWLKRTNDPFDTGKRLPITNMLDIGQAFTTSSWLSKVHPEYANCIKNNFADFKTGEQTFDIKPIFR